MQESIYIEPAGDTPGVILDKESGVFKFFGRSLPEDVNKFYGSIQKWFIEYCKNPNPTTEITFNLDYFNSSTARILVKILIETENIHNNKSKVHVSWFYNRKDYVMHDRGNELKSVLNIPFDLKAV